MDSKARLRQAHFIQEEEGDQYCPISDSDPEKKSLM